jgi:predicted aminopeptidase
MQISFRLTRVLIVILTALLSGCANLAFYAQAVNGHVDLMRRAQPIHAIIADPDADADLKRTLSTVARVRAFASTALGLPDNRSYTHYADLERPYAVWNVVATPELSTRLKEWCFVQAGCVNYRGFFSQARAEDYARKLATEGYDVHVSGVPAYSTLGWFNDPVLNTFIHHSELELARLIFHELAHQVVFVPGDTVFNESFATLVEQEGVRRWLAHNNAAAKYTEYQARHARQAAFNTLILHHRRRLDALFNMDMDDAQKRAGKARIFEDLRAQYELLKTSRTEFSRFDPWFAQPLNNARLARVSIYTQLLPAFQALLAQQDGEMNHFFDAVKKIGQLPKAERLPALQRIADENRRDAIASAF